MKYIITALLLILIQQLSAQITVDKYNLTIESQLPDTLQRIYEEFLNTNVAKVSIVRLKKKYDQWEYNHFLKHKKFYQGRKKWIKNHSFEESIIIEGDLYPLVHFDSIVFEYTFRGIETEFIQSELFLDSAETRLAFSQMFSGTENDIISICYMPRHAVLFYNDAGRVSGIYEICFECSNVTIGIVGTRLFASNLTYLRSLFEKHKDELE